MEDRSILEYMRTELVSIWGSHLIVKDGWSSDLENIVLPAVTINYVTDDSVPRGLGESTNDDINYWHIMVFARGKGERDDISYDIKQLLGSGCGVYDFSAGSQGEKIGYMNFTNIRIKPILAERNRSVVIARAEVSITET